MTAFDRCNRYHIAIHLVSNVTDISSILKETDLDQGALGEYQEFLLNIFAVLDEHEFEVSYDESGYRSESIYCITAFKSSESTAEDFRCRISIRIFGEYSPTAFEAARLKQSSRKKQTWRLKNITVNGEAFAGYYEALEGIGRLLTY